jgi:general secretion pathway protein L
LKQRIATWSQLTSRFLRWWAEELKLCAEDLVGVLLRQRRRVLTVYWDATRLLVVDEHSSDPKSPIEIPGVGAAGWPQTMPAALAAMCEQTNRVRLVVSPERAYVRQFQLPLAVLPHLDAAMALQMPKLLPVDASKLLTDFELNSNVTADSLACIDLAALKRADVNPVLEILRAWGLHVVSTHLGPPLQQARRFKFADQGASGRQFKFRGSDRALAIAAATLGLACVSVAATESYRSQVSLEQAKTATRAPASAALARRQQLLARLEPLNALTQLEATPSAAALLAELTALVPQNTWLTTLELKDQHLRIVGVSPNSGNVVKLASSSRLMSDVQLRSSMSLGVGTGLDRFEITAELKAGSP